MASLLSVHRLQTTGRRGDGVMTAIAAIDAQKSQENISS